MFSLVRSRFAQHSGVGGNVAQIISQQQHRAGGHAKGFQETARRAVGAKLAQQAGHAGSLWTERIANFSTYRSSKTNIVSENISELSLQKQSIAPSLMNQIQRHDDVLPSATPSTEEASVSPADQHHLPVIAVDSLIMKNQNDCKKMTLSEQIGNKGLVFEFSVSWIAIAYKNIVIGLVRNVMYTFRPVLFLWLFGWAFKFAFFLLGAPMLLSFYSVWLFEVGYGLFQCFLSVIFLTQLAYMDMSFRGRLRPIVQLAKNRVQRLVKRVTSLHQ